MKTEITTGGESKLLVQPKTRAQIVSSHSKMNIPLSASLFCRSIGGEKNLFVFMLSFGREICRIHARFCVNVHENVLVQMASEEVNL